MHYSPLPPVSVVPTQHSLPLLRNVPSGTPAHMSGSGVEAPIPPVKRNRMRRNRVRKRSRMRGLVVTRRSKRKRDGEQMEFSDGEEEAQGSPLLSSPSPQPHLCTSSPLAPHIPSSRSMPLRPRPGTSGQCTDCYLSPTLPPCCLRSAVSMCSTPSVHGLEHLMWFSLPSSSDDRSKVDLNEGATGVLQLFHGIVTKQ